MCVYKVTLPKSKVFYCAIFLDVGKKTNQPKQTKPKNKNKQTDKRNQLAYI